MNSDSKFGAHSKPYFIQWKWKIIFAPSRTIFICDGIQARFGSRPRSLVLGGGASPVEPSWWRRTVIRGSLASFGISVWGVVSFAMIWLAQPQTPPLHAPPHSTLDFSLAYLCPRRRRSSGKCRLGMVIIRKLRWGKIKFFKRRTSKYRPV